MRKLLGISFLLWLNIFNVYSQEGKSIEMINMLPIGYVKDGSVDYTREIQKVLDLYDSIVFPDFPLLVNDDGLKLKSSQSIFFKEGGGLVLKSSSKSHYSVLLMKSIKNVTIDNLAIKGDRYTHLSKGGEWGMGIKISGSSNILIKNTHISDCWGDGIYIGRDSDIISKNITINDSSISFCRRNGISVISVDSLMIKNVNISNINGTLPMASIDIEPNSPKDYLGVISIEDFVSNNSETGIQIGLSRYPSISTNNRNVVVKIRNFSSINDGKGILYGDYFREYNGGELKSKLRGSISFEKIRIVNSGKESLKYFSKFGYKFSPEIIFREIRIKNNSIKSNSDYLFKLKKDFDERGFQLENVKIEI